MVFEFDLDGVEVTHIMEGVAAVLLAPVVLPIAAGLNQPLVKGAVQEGIAFMERCREAVAEAGEQFEDFVAETQEMIAQGRSGTLFEALPDEYDPEEPSDAAEEIIDIVADLNEQVGHITHGLADLRFFMPLGLSLLALRQLYCKGLQIDEIPWYTFAWYAFDSFIKLNHPDEFLEEHRDHTSRVEPLPSAEAVWDAPIGEAP